MTTHFCLFDIDGTLLSSGGAGQAAMEATLEKMFNVTDPLHGVSTAGRTDRAIVSELFAHFDIDHDEQIWNDFLDAYLGELPRMMTEKDGRILSGVPEILESLHSREDVVMGLLTGNFARGATAKLSHFELDHYFAFGGFGDHHPLRDDVARQALSALEEHHTGDVDPADVWVIGDTPADVQCGRAIGAKVVAVGTGMYSLQDLEAAQPDHLFADFSEPDEFLQLFA